MNRQRRYLRNSDVSFDFDFVSFKKWMLVDKSMAPGVASDMCTYLRKALLGMNLRTPSDGMARDFVVWREGEKSDFKAKGARAIYLAMSFLALKRSV